MITYRKADLNDVQALIACRKQQLDDEGEFFDVDIDNELSEFFISGLSDNSFISWLALDEGNVIATSGVCFYRLPPTFRNPTGKVAYITNMYTHRAYRRQGIGSRLLQYVIDEIKKHNIKVIRLHASDDGKTIYGEAGFVDSDGYMALWL